MSKFRTSLRKINESRLCCESLFMRSFTEKGRREEEGSKQRNRRGGRKGEWKEEREKERSQSTLPHLRFLSPLIIFFLTWVFRFSTTLTCLIKPRSLYLVLSFYLWISILDTCIVILVNEGWIHLSLTNFPINFTCLNTLASVGLVLLI